MNKKLSPTAAVEERRKQLKAREDAVARRLRALAG